MNITVNQNRKVCIDAAPVVCPMCGGNMLWRLGLNGMNSVGFDRASTNCRVHHEKVSGQAISAGFGRDKAMRFLERAVADYLEFLNQT
jgi:hypothetical protein